MRKKFNITGSCNPERHYMVDSKKRFQAIEGMIDACEYFTINRARQYGKTTMLYMIWRRLSERYIVVPMSFEGLGDPPFASEEAFIKTFSKLMAGYLTPLKLDAGLMAIWEDSKAKSMDELAEVITLFCRKAPKPVILTIDEVDKSSDNQLFLNFLGMLRNRYLERDLQGMDSTFHSVILAGVYDVKNLKVKLRPDAEKKYNSPWNISADFNVDMTFHSEEIAQMLTDYEKDEHTGMDIQAVSEEIYKFTTGYPFLVSKLCKVIDEQLNKDWTAGGVQTATKQTILEKNTLFTSLTKNLENHPELKQFIFAISVNGDEVTYDVNNPVMDFATMFSIIRYDERRKVRIHNIIFEEVLNNYFIAEQTIKNLGRLRMQMNYVRDGRLDMELVITRFADLMHEEYRESTVPFLEREGRLLFLTFLKPIINGTGFYYVEPQTRDNRRMDLVVTYGSDEFVIELKIWRGEKYEEKGRDQLASYLAARGTTEGYLVTFDFSKRQKEAAPHWVEHMGKRIFEVTV
ncbi:MAG: AAA-like domain-containing protein [Prevotella sp.]|nr:AAA-like domain-containing protein [Prevotella sp.]